jgi:hypothetical protein
VGVFGLRRGKHQQNFAKFQRKPAKTPIFCVKMSLWHRLWAGDGVLWAYNATVLSLLKLSPSEIQQEFSHQAPTAVGTRSLHRQTSSSAFKSCPIGPNWVEARRFLIGISLFLAVAMTSVRIW